MSVETKEGETMEDPTAVAEVLERAADVLFVRGRTTVVGQDGDGQVCVLGAIAVAEERSPFHWTKMFASEAAMALASYLLDNDLVQLWKFHHSYDAPWVWNDATPRSPENDAEVIDTIRKCAKSIRNGEA